MNRVREFPQITIVLILLKPWRHCSLQKGGVEWFEYTVLRCMDILSRKPGLVYRVLILHTGSRGFDSHQGHMFERFFRSNRPGYLHPVSSELENNGIRVAVSDCSVTERRRWHPPIKPAKLCRCTQNTTNRRTDAQHCVCAAMVPYR